MQSQLQEVRSDADTHAADVRSVNGLLTYLQVRC